MAHRDSLEHLQYAFEMFVRLRILLQRQRDLQGRTLHFITRTGRRPWVKVYPVEDVPPFDGEQAWFEVRQERGRGPRLVGPFSSRYDV